MSVSKVLLQSAIDSAEKTKTYKTADALFKAVAKSKFAQKKQLTSLQLLQLAVEKGCTCKSVEELKLPEPKRPASSGTGRKGREKLIVDETKLREVITELEDSNTYDKLNDLWQAVADTEWAKDHAPRPLTASVVYQRVKEYGIETKTQPARKRRQPAVVDGGGNEVTINEDGPTRTVVVRTNDAMSAENAGIPRFRGVGLTVVPAGACPFKLTGTDFDTVKSWCTKVVESAFRQHQQIAPSGLIYYARHFFGIFGPEYQTVKEHILACKYEIYGTPDTGDNEDE